MKHFFALLLLCIIHLAVGDQNSFGFVVEPDKFKKPYNPCSRLYPEKISGYWKPMAMDLLEISSNLDSLEQANAVCGTKPSPFKIDSSQVQLLGIVVEGDSLIYMNGFPKTKSKLSRKQEKKLTEQMREVCDGGNRFWGATWNKKTKKYSKLCFNGEG